MTKLKTVRLARHVTRMGPGRNIFKILVGNLQEIGTVNNAYLGSGIKLKCILQKEDWRVWIEFM